VRQRVIALLIMTAAVFAVLPISGAEAAVRFSSAVSQYDSPGSDTGSNTSLKRGILPAEEYRHAYC